MMARSAPGIMARIRLTTAIAAMVVIGILVSFGATLVAVQMALTSRIEGAAELGRQNAIRAAATVLKSEMNGAVVTWSEAGDIASITTWVLPTSLDNTLVDSFHRITGETAAVLGFNAASGEFVQMTGSVIGADGTRFEHPPIGKDDPIYETVTSGKAVEVDTQIGGVPQYSVYQPITDSTGENVLALLYAGVSKAGIEAVRADMMQLLMMIGGGAVLAVGLLALVMSRIISRPIPVLSKVMAAIADNRLDVEVPYTTNRNEVGDMARAVAVFRDNAARIAQMSDAEARSVQHRATERAQMMQQLQREFGAVVDAAIAGDFSRRITARFDDKELNALASSVNLLVERVDAGLGATADVLAAMAETDLTQRVKGDFSGGFGKLQTDTNLVAERLGAVMSRLRDTSGLLKTATGEILSGATDLNERTTKQAATIEETSAAMEQLSRTVTHNAVRAREASSVAVTVTQTAEAGGKVMANANEAMERITSSSGKISNIIGLIDDIAFQTNLLALNASVEAARAGETGKGFAVVAVEVRRLAQSAAEASSQVKVLIDQSGTEVQAGSRLVAEAVAKLGTILEAARSSSQLMEAIARDSGEQASAIEQVGASVRALDEMTQHNAALVEQTNAAIEQTEAQVAELDGIVAGFRIDEGMLSTGRRRAA